MLIIHNILTHLFNDLLTLEYDHDDTVWLK